MMHILVLEQQPSRLRGGQERSLFDVVRGLARRGHRVDLLYTQNGDLLDEYQAVCATTTRVNGFVVDRGKTIRSAACFVADALRPGLSRPDLVYANQYLDSPFGRLIAARFRRPFVCHLRLPPADVFSAQYRWGLRGAVRMIATSRQTRDDYVSRGFRTDRIDVVYNGIDLREWQANGDPARTRERFGVPVGAFLLAFAGRLHPGKGVDVLLDAMQRLPERVHLVIAGQHHEDGSRRDYKAELVMHAGQRAVSERVRFVGHLADPRDLFAAADLTILPSVISEAFGRTVIESMACGTPAVASRVGGIPEILAGNWASMLVPPGDGAALAQRIMTLMDWRSRDPELAARCRAHVEQRFDVRGMVNGVEASLARAIDDWTAGLAVPAATAALR